VIALREREFVRAAYALGAPGWRIMLRHIVPNVVGPTLVLGSYYVAITIIAEAGTSFIGVGAQPPTPSLGQIIAEGQNYWSQDVWVVALPGAVLALIVLGLNTLGDGLRDLVDPRLRTRG
jgi:peptide/nickel transport system permease protein